MHIRESVAGTVQLNDFWRVANMSEMLKKDNMQDLAAMRGLIY